MILLLLALTCLKVGTFVFGGGMTMIPMMEQDVVTRYKWLTHREFVDGIALGQMTPGPLLVSATFVGYKVAGFAGAVTATVCIFLPSCLMTILVSRALDRLKRSKHVQALLRGLNASVIGLLLAAAFSIGKSSLVDLWTVLFALGTIVCVIRYKVDSALIILTAGALGSVVFR